MSAARDPGYDASEDVDYFRRTSPGYKRRVREALAEAQTGAEIAYLTEELRQVEWLEERGQPDERASDRQRGL